MKRALVFLAITFGITYAYDFLVVYPIAEGIAAMCAWCTVLAIFLSYVTIRTGSTFAAALGHGAVNGTTNGVTLFSLTGGNPFVGPLCTGIVGGLPLLGGRGHAVGYAPPREGRHAAHSRGGPSRRRAPEPSLAKHHRFAPIKRLRPKNAGSNWPRRQSWQRRAARRTQ